MKTPTKSVSGPEPLRMAPGRRRILLVDDHTIVRQGLSRIINQESDLQICGESAHAAGALAAAAELHPDLMIVDVSLEASNGIELIKSLRARGDRVPVLVLSMHDEALYAERALKAGAQGYIMKQEGAEVVIEAIRRILSGKNYLSERMSSEILQRMLEGSSSAKGGRWGVDKLSDRELEVYEWIGRGLATGDIAQKLHLSVKTIETYRAHIKEKLGIHSGVALVHHAVRWVEAERPSA